jgi:hypothetical protein
MKLKTIHIIDLICCIKSVFGRLAKEGTIEVPTNWFTTIPLSVGKKLIKKQLELDCQDTWAA